MVSFFRKTGWLILFAALQVGFWNISRQHLPDMSIVPEVPGKISVKALSFGDEEFYYRVLGYQIQTAGDTFGRFTALYKYDYKRLYAWFTLLDSLDNDSDYIAFLASYYYSQTQYTPDVRYVVEYLYEHSKERPGKNYWWLSQAAYLAEHRLNDRDLALKVAAPLEHADDAPFWARELPAFVHERRGEMEDAARIIENIKEHSANIPPYELKFMRYFVEERIKKLEHMEQKGQ